MINARTITFNIRFSPAEMAQLKLQAQAKGWSVGRLVRYRCLTGGSLEEKKVAEMEKQMRKTGGRM